MNLRVFLFNKTGDFGWLRFVLYVGGKWCRFQFAWRQSVHLPIRFSLFAM